MKNVSIIGTNGLPGRYGGWDQLMNHLTVGLKSEFKFTVYTSIYNAVEGLTHVNDAELRIVNLKANGVQSIPYDAYSMLDSVLKKHDVLLIMGISGCIFLPFIKPFAQKIVLNIDGAEWKRGKWGYFAKWFLKQSERFGVRFADVVIADNKIIQDYVWNEYNKQAELIAYGGDNVRFVSLSRENEKKYRILSKSYAFKVCRIEPENNLDMILEAFVDIEYPLVIVGNWNNSQYGIELRKKFIGYENIRLLDPIYEQELIDELRGNCGVYIHGHSVGGTNPSLVEAMSLALCCIVFDVNYNRETTENSSLYFTNKQDLVGLMSKILKNEINTSSIAEKLKEIAMRRYRWSVITEQYAQLLR